MEKKALAKCCGLLTGPRATGSTFRRNDRPDISSRNSRVAALQERWDRLRAGLGLILEQRGAGMDDLPRRRQRVAGGHYKGKEADRLVTRIDPGVVSLSPNCAATSVRRLRNRASGRPASRSTR